VEWNTDKINVPSELNSVRDNCHPSGTIIPERRDDEAGELEGKYNFNP